MNSKWQFSRMSERFGQAEKTFQDILTLVHYASFYYLSLHLYNFHNMWNSRRTIVMNRKYTCRKGSGNCEMMKEERYLCRSCRYQKCLELGMQPHSKRAKVILIEIEMNNILDVKNRPASPNSQENGDKSDSLICRFSKLAVFEILISWKRSQV